MMIAGAELLQTGIGLRQPHWQEITASRPAAGFLEIHAENFLGDTGWNVLEDLRRDYPFSVHAVGISLASAEGVDMAHLDRIAGLIERLEPALVSDHLCWSSQNGAYFNDLMPFPYTEESLGVVAANIQKVQERLKRPILIENISAYLQFRNSIIPEAAFMAALVERTGCGILCDVNNAYVDQVNHGVDALNWMNKLPAEAVYEIHLAGHCVNRVEACPVPGHGGGEVLIDDHGSRIIEPVWKLYAEAIKLFPQAASLVEWDANIPVLAVLLGEAGKADSLRACEMEAENAVAA